MICRHCFKTEQEHVGTEKQCLFGSTYYQIFRSSHVKSQAALILVLKELDTKRSVLREQRQSLENQLAVLGELIVQVNEKCTHEHPDGTSAIKHDGFICNNCTICGWSDL